MGFSTAVLLNWKGKKHKSGVYPIHIRVILDRKPDYYRVQLPVNGISPIDWQDKEDAWVKNTHEYNYQINKAIRDLKCKITDLNKRFFDQHKKLTHFHIKRDLNFSGDRLIFNDYFKNYIKNPPEVVLLETATWEKYQSFIGHLDNFNPKLKFSEIDVDTAARIRNHLMKQPGQKSTHMAPASVKSLFDKFLVVLQYAAEEDNLIAKDLVDKIANKVFVKVPDRDEGLHWDVQDIRNLKKVPESAMERSQIRDRKLFLLQIYGSWYYSDLIYMNRKHVHFDHEFGMYVMGGRSKNDQARIVPLWKFPGAEEIMNEFEDPDPKSTYWFRRDAFVDAQVYNRNLKVIADKAGVTREVTAKTARHTGMTLMARMGVQYPALKKMAGQKISDVGGVYIKFGLKEIIDATEVAKFDKLGI